VNPTPPEYVDALPPGIEHPSWCFVVEDWCENDVGTHHKGQARVVAGYGACKNRPISIRIAVEWTDVVPEYRGQLPAEVLAPVVLLDSEGEDPLRFTPSQARHLAAALLDAADHLEPQPAPHQT
jgi:hypothetical protein